MKILWPLIVLLFIQCASPVVFTEPQPADTADRSRFEFHFQGHYYCLQDSSLLVIEPDLIYKEQSISFVSAKPELESAGLLRIENGELYYGAWTLPVEVLFQNDSLLAGNLIQRDTLFTIGTDRVLNYYQGYQILNLRIAEREWEVWLLGRDGYGNLQLLRSHLPETPAELEAVTPVEDLSTEEEVRYRLSPTRSEFRRLLTDDVLFEEAATFRRIKRTVIYN